MKITGKGGWVFDEVTGAPLQAQQGFGVYEPLQASIFWVSHSVDSPVGGYLNFWGKVRNWCASSGEGPYRSASQFFGEMLWIRYNNFAGFLSLSGRGSVYSVHIFGGHCGGGFGCFGEVPADVVLRG